MSFIHLHNHTHFSILEGLPKPKDYIKAAKALGMNAVAITDTGNIHGCHEFYKYAKEEGIKAILGTEIFLQSSLDEKMFHKIVLLAKNFDGYKNIIALITKANLENGGNTIHITFEDLKNYSSDLICLSGPITSEISYYILSGQSEEKIVSRIKEYEELFPGDFYLELLYHDDIPKQKLVTDYLIELHKKYNFKVVAANNCYYVKKDDKKTQDIIRALGTGHQIDNPDRPTMINGDYSFLNEEEMQYLFGFIPSAISNTQEIADKIDIKIKTGGILIPKYELPEDDKPVYEEAMKLEENDTTIKKLSSDEWYLRYLSYKGLNWRYNYGLSKEQIFEFVKKMDKPGLQQELTKTSPEELKELGLIYYTDKKKEYLKDLDLDILDKIDRLEYELVVVHEMGFDGYFLIVADYINWARKESIPVGPGRGSAAGSLMAFLSGITDLDPLPYNLLFERFLNPARVSMPDIDVDFADDARDEVITYCQNKYGADHVAQICTFGTFAARAAVKDVARVMGLEFSESNELAKLIPEKPGTKLKDALEESLEFKTVYDTNENYRDIIDNALKIEGNVRQLGVHACAVIIAPEPMTNFTALAHPPKDNTTVVTQYSAYPLEDLGLLKMDFLGLRNLTIIKRALKIIKTRKGIDVDILKINLEDQKVFQVFASGDTTGVFQFESDGMRKYLQELKPNCFEDIIVMVSLYRPGPLAYIPTYIDRKHGREKVEYPHPSLEKILSPTQGIAVYQEQIMQMVQAFAGFSLGEADILRRAIGKKKIDVLMAQKQIFIDAAKREGHSEELAKHIFEDVIEPFAGYGFNKSHAACYAFISYQTAYLKAYFPTEFLTALMVSDEENLERIVMEVSECEEKGIKVLPPSVGESLKHFTYIDDNNIRYGLKAIKGIGDGPINAIIERRKDGIYNSMQDFVSRTGREVINKKSLEALILSGALDEYGERGLLFKNIENIIRFSKIGEKAKTSSQLGMFDNIESESSLVFDKFPAFSFEEKLAGERLVIGQSISGHPLDGLGRYIEKRSQHTKVLKIGFDEIEKLPEKEKSRNTVVQAVGYVKDLRKTMTKSGGNMVFLYCESFYYDFEVTIFPKDYDKFKDKLQIDKIIIVNGGLNINTEYKRKGILARDIKNLTITQAREQAMSLGLFDDVKYKKIIYKTQIVSEPKSSENNLATSEVIQENIIIESQQDFIEIQEDNSMVESVVDTQNEFIENQIISDEIITNQEKKEINKYVINIPLSAKKEDLVDLKQFLLTMESGNIQIFICLKGQEIDTKISIKNLGDLLSWEKVKFR